MKWTSELVRRSYFSDEKINIERSRVRNGRMREKKWEQERVRDRKNAFSIAGIKNSNSFVYKRLIVKFTCIADKKLEPQDICISDHFGDNGRRGGSVQSRIVHVCVCVIWKRRASLKTFIWSTIYCKLWSCTLDVLCVCVCVLDYGRLYVMFCVDIKIKLCEFLKMTSCLCCC